MAKTQFIRLLLTITADKMPDWYNCLESIDSGHVRAAVVREALKKIRPGQIQLVNRLDSMARTDPSDPLTQADVIAQEGVRHPDVKHLDVEQPTERSTRDDSLAEDEMVENELPRRNIDPFQMDAPQELTDPTGSIPLTGGMAAGIIRGNLQENWAKRPIS